MITSRSQRSPSSASASSYSTRVTAAQSAFRFPAARTSRFRSASLAPAAAPAAAAAASSPPDPTRRFPGPSAVRSAIVRSCAASRTGCSQRSNAASMSSHPSGA